MSGKHTPGPWRPHFSERAEDYRVCATGADGDCICCVALMGNLGEDGKWDEATLEEWKANARLIAAAPDMLAALKRVQEYAKNNLCKIDRVFICGILDPAIAAAEGTTDGR